MSYKEKHSGETIQFILWVLTSFETGEDSSLGRAFHLDSPNYDSTEVAMVLITHNSIFLVTPTYYTGLDDVENTMMMNVHITFEEL